MKRVLGRFWDFIERFYPSNPFAISFTFSRFFLMIVIVSTVAGVIYLRSENKNELELLRAKHEEIQLMITNYLRDMSQVNLNSDRQKQLREMIGEYQKKLQMVDADIKRIQKVWFLE